MSKTRIIVVMLLLSGLFFAAVRAVQADTKESDVIDTGCVGNCGDTSTIIYEVPEREDYGTMFSVAQTYSSLCPSKRAEAQIIINSEEEGVFDLMDPQAEIEFTADPNDVITVVVQLLEADPNVRCIWLGDLQFALKQPRR